jgi:transposase
LRKAYQLREKLTAICSPKQSQKAAPPALRGWIAAVKRSGLDCFDKFLGTLDDWRDEITNYFLSRLERGWVEGFNNKIKVLKRLSAGINSAEMLFRRLWLDTLGAAGGCWLMPQDVGGFYGNSQRTRRFGRTTGRAFH